jgi:hypothetical protein
MAQGTVRTVHVVMVGVLRQHRHQMPTSEDEHPVQHLPPDSPNPSLRVGIGPRCQLRLIPLLGGRLSG